MAGKGDAATHDGPGSALPHNNHGAASMIFVQLPTRFASALCCALTAGTRRIRLQPAWALRSRVRLQAELQAMHV